MPDATVWWAPLAVWAVVNAVTVLQTVGFATRPTRGMAVNRRVGLAIAALAVPATIAMVALVREQSPQWTGPAVFDLFVAMMLLVDYVRPVEFRSPLRPAILVPYLLLFFGSILLMGLPMYWMHRGLWLVTVTTSAALLATMLWSLRRGYG